MIGQRDLFTAPPATTSQTPSPKDSKITLLEQVRRAFERAGPRGFTDEELHDDICTGCGKRKEGSVRGRRCELLAAGEIADSGQRRLSVAGVESTVWTLPRFVGAKSPDGTQRVDSAAAVSGEICDRRQPRSTPPTTSTPTHGTTESTFATGKCESSGSTATIGECPINTPCLGRSAVPAGQPDGTIAGTAPCHAGPPWRHVPRERITFDGYLRTECTRCGEVLRPDRKAEATQR